MATVALKRGAAPPRAKARPKPPAAPPVALPVAPGALRRNLAILVGLIVAGLGIAALLLTGGWARLQTEALRTTAQAGFEIRRVEISGTRELPRLAVYQAALTGPTNAMLAADLGAIRARLLEQPWVADASVSRRLPDTLDIAITERRPVALWQFHQRFHAIDITGRPLTDQHLERYASLPVVVGPGANARVRELLALVAAAPGLAGQIDAGVLVGGRRWDIRFKSRETLLLPDQPAAASTALKRFARLAASQPPGTALIGSGRYARFDMRLPGRIIVGGPAVAEAIAAAEKAAKAAAKKPATV